MPDKGARFERRGVIADEWFDRIDRIPMTKAPTRALIMSLLNPLAGMNILEIGSGSGAVTVELSRAAGDRGRVTSLEISPAAVSLTKRNLERSGFDKRVRVIEGRAPKHIPIDRYDAVFIGGHGEELEAIMGTCLDMMEQGGRLALTSISPGTTARTLAYLDKYGASAGFWRAQASFGKKTDTDWIVCGNNPVDIIWGDK
jgi:precorrin-6Y C5,15-methyltransferase (decarboxylating) CbiT subunit